MLVPFPPSSPPKNLPSPRQSVPSPVASPPSSSNRLLPYLHQSSFLPSLLDLSFLYTTLRNLPYRFLNKCSWFLNFLLKIQIFLRIINPQLSRIATISTHQIHSPRTTSHSVHFLRTAFRTTIGHRLPPQSNQHDETATIQSPYLRHQMRNKNSHQEKSFPYPSSTAQVP